MKERDRQTDRLVGLTAQSPVGPCWHLKWWPKQETGHLKSFQNLVTEMTHFLISKFIDIVRKSRNRGTFRQGHFTADTAVWQLLLDSTDEGDPIHSIPGFTKASPGKFGSEVFSGHMPTVQSSQGDPKWGSFLGAIHRKASLCIIPQCQHKATILWCQQKQCRGFQGGEVCAKQAAD